MLAAFCWLGLNVPRATRTLELASFFCRYKGAFIGFLYVLLQQMHIEPHWAPQGWGDRVNEQTLHHYWTHLGTLGSGIKQLPRAQTLWAVSRVVRANGAPELESPA